MTTSLSHLQCLQWLLQKVEELCVAHDIPCQFSVALFDHSIHQTAAKMKAEREKEEKEARYGEYVQQ